MKKYSAVVLFSFMLAVISLFLPWSYFKSFGDILGYNQLYLSGITRGAYVYLIFFIPAILKIKIEKIPDSLVVFSLTSGFLVLSFPVSIYTYNLDARALSYPSLTRHEVSYGFYLFLLSVLVINFYYFFDKYLSNNSIDIDIDIDIDVEKNTGSEVYLDGDSPIKESVIADNSLDYEIELNKFKNGVINSAVWSKSIVQALGDEEKAKYIYVQNIIDFNKNNQNVDAEITAKSNSVVHSEINTTSEMSTVSKIIKWSIFIIFTIPYVFGVYLLSLSGVRITSDTSWIFFFSMAVLCSIVSFLLIRFVDRNWF